MREMRNPQPPKDGNHALLVGQLWGLLMRAKDEGHIRQYGVRTLMLGSDYSDTIEVTRPSGVYHVTVTQVRAFDDGDRRALTELSEADLLPTGSLAGTVIGVEHPDHPVQEALRNYAKREDPKES